LLLVRMLAGTARLWNISHAATPILVNGAGRVRESPQISVPMVWGWFGPVVLVPAGFQDWPVERRDAVLRHEQAHVTRHDFGTELLAPAAAFIYWFHPLGWLAVSGRRRESEAACDDQVLLAGIGPADYASHLLDVARSLRPAPYALMAVTMARRSQLE